MTTTKREEALKILREIELREFPADVQDILRARAIERCVPIQQVIEDYLVEKSEQIVEATRGVA